MYSFIYSFICAIYISSSCHAISMDILDPLPHPSLSSIASDRSSRSHSVSAQNCCMKFLAVHTALSRPCEGDPLEYVIYDIVPTSPVCLVYLTWIVFVMGGKWLYSCCFVGCCSRTFCILLSAFLIYIYVFIYTVIHRQICFVLSELISVVKQARFPKLGSKPGWLKRQSKIQPRGNQRKRRKFKRVWITIAIVYIYPLNGYRELDSYEEPCMYANGNTITSFARELVCVCVCVCVCVFCVCVCVCVCVCIYR